MKLALSLFPGLGLLDRAFEQAGFCVVSNGDIIWGRDVRRFKVVPGFFDGIFGGSPCQDFSKARRSAPTGEGIELVNEFVRVVDEGQPNWFLLENVPRVPNVTVQGYHVQRFNLNAKECGVAQNRLRTFQFGCRTGKPLVIRRLEAPAELSHCCLASEGKRHTRRTFADFCELQGLPRDFDLPDLSRQLKYKLVGNGVPLPMGVVIANAIKAWSANQDQWQRVCVCGCGAPVRDGQTQATAACRKREQRKRDSAGVTGPGSVTTAASQVNLILQAELGSPV